MLTENAARTWRRTELLGAIALLSALLGTALWWYFPERVDTPYARITLMQGLQLRALAGTLAALWPRSVSDIMLPMLASNILAWWIWMFCCLWVAGRSASGSRIYRWLTLLCWAVLFGFNTVSFNAWVNFFIDTQAAAWMATAALACVYHEKLPAWALCVWVTLAPVLAVMTHESAFALWVVLALWGWWKMGVKKAAAVFLPGAVAIAAILMLFPSPDQALVFFALPMREYVNILLHENGFVWKHSGNIYGLAVGPGTLWLVYAYLGWVWIRNGKSGAPGRAALVLAMPAAALATLFVALDTNRMAAALWLPAMLLLGAVGSERLLANGERRLLAILVPLALLQIFNPPSLIYDNVMVPYSCYTLRLARGLKPWRGEQQTRTWELYFHDTHKLSQLVAQRCESH